MLQQELNRVTDRKTRRDIVSLSMIVDEIMPEIRILSEKIETAESFQVNVEDSTRTKHMRGICLIYNYTYTIN